jgi:hypothetical protein
MKSKKFVSSCKSVDWLIWLGDNKNDTCYFIGGYHGNIYYCNFYYNECGWGDCNE